MSDEKSTDKNTVEESPVHNWKWIFSHLRAIPWQDWASLITGLILSGIPAYISSKFVPPGVNKANWLIVFLSFFYGLVVLIFRVDERKGKLGKDLAHELLVILGVILVLIMIVAYCAAKYG